VNAAAIQNPWRTVRRMSRTECRRAPSSCAIIGDVAVTRPMPKIMKAKYRLCARAPAASASAESQPSRITSMVLRPCWARLVRISGQARVNVAPTSAIQGLRARVMGGV
jgi:hypothetical protein